MPAIDPKYFPAAQPSQFGLNEGYWLTRLVEALGIVPSLATPFELVRVIGAAGRPFAVPETARLRHKLARSLDL